MKIVGRHVAFLLIVSTLLVACDESQSASTANFKKALQSYYEHHPVCVSMALTLPANVGVGGIEPTRPQLEALAKVGVLSATEVKQPEAGRSGKNQRPDRILYSVAPGAEKFVRAGHDSFIGGTDLCFARRRITKVESFTTPTRVMGRKAPQVTYDFDLVDVASWAKNATIANAFPAIKATLAKSSSKETEAIVLTDKGWRLEEDVR